MFYLFNIFIEKNKNCVYSIRYFGFNKEFDIEVIFVFNEFCINK